MDKILEKNIRQTIDKMKNDGTVGASVACLKQCTPTTGVTMSVLKYHSEFPKVAKTIATKMKFDLY